MKKWVFSVAVLCLLSAFRSYRDSDFAAGDNTLSSILGFHNTDTVFVIYPDGYPLDHQDSQKIENYAFWTDFQPKPVYMYFSESNRNKTGKSKSLQFYGPVFMFKNLPGEGLPVEVCNNGFRFNDHEFNEPGDAVFYVDESRKLFITCPNSKAAPFPYNRMPAGYYPLVIFRSQEIEFTGIPANNELLFNNHKMLREACFTRTVYDDKFQNLFPDSGFDSTSILETKKVLNFFLEELAKELSIDLSDVPAFKNYFYHSPGDINAFLGLPPQMTVYGKSLGNVNHIYGINYDILKHETGHSIIEFAIGQNPCPFWHEGFRQYTDYLLNPPVYSEDLEKCVDSHFRISTELILDQTGKFFSSWNNYPLSGIFTKMVADRLGLETFKKAYAEDSIEKHLEKTDISLSCLCQEFEYFIKREYEKHGSKSDRQSNALFLGDETFQLRIKAL